MPLLELNFVWDRKQFLAHMTHRAAFQAYFDSFSPMDLQVRRQSGVYNAETYLGALVPRSAVPKDLMDKGGAFWRVVGEAEKRLRLLASKQRNGDELRALVEAGENESVPWVLAFVEDRVEGGMPHTHGGVICLPFKWALMGSGSPAAAFIQTLIHERIHILQRRFPQIAQKLVYQMLRIRPAMHRHDLEPFLKSHWRTNPDLDSYVYSDGVIALFNDNAETLSNIHLVSLFKRGLPTIPSSKSSNSSKSAESEHPFETMAYRVAADAMLML